MIDLFGDPEKTPAGRQAGPRFSTAFAWAFAGHVFLLAVLLLARSSGSVPSSPEMETMRRALAEIAREAVPPGTRPEASSDPEALARTLGESIRFSDEADLKKKVEIVKVLLRSFYRAADDKEGSYFDLSKLSLDEIQAKIEEGSIRLPGGEKAFAIKNPGSEHEMEIHTLDGEDEAQIALLAGNGTGDGGPASSSRIPLARESKFGTGNRRPDSSARVPPEAKSIPPEIYYRECPYERILARGPSLFTVVEGIHEFVPPANEKKENGTTSKAVSTSRSADPALLTVLLSADGFSFQGDESESLGYAEIFAPDRMAAALEKLMQKPEVEQFADFRRDYLNRFDPDSPELSRFTGQFISSNLNGVFYTPNLFAEAFDSLEELFYKRPIYDGFLSYGRRHPETKTAAEFLFGLAAAYDFERRTLALIIEIEPEASEILASGASKPGVFESQAKAYVLKKIAEKTRTILARKGFTKIDEALKKYRDASLAIYYHLAEKDGDIRDRALFAVGDMFWEEGDINRAFAAWRRIRSSFDSPSFQHIRIFLNSRGRDLAVAGESIRKYLARQAGAGNQALLNRQIRFHKWSNRARSWAGQKTKTN